jgi:hypothetical protein
VKELTLKPYALVVVERHIAGFTYRHIGEVMSFPIDNQVRGAPQTVMVRRVPAHPKTLDELHVTTLSAPISKPKFVHYAEVSDTMLRRGFGSFPVDMLRYEMAAPVNFKLVEHDVFVKAELLADFLNEQCFLIAHANAKKTPQWSEARWKSFGWNLEPLHSEKIGGAL